ncbi:MAG: hypothetical protein LBM02_06075 [Lachnospiraceae bacterium]|jgi:hypothetical protein|nr:hypothetical protein [Lachnospiraceae bacterium]
MFKFKKSFLSLCLATSLVATSFVCVPVKAGSVTATYKGAFSKAWQRYKTGDSGRALVTYGYNTAFINEDYAWAKHSTKTHYSSLRNGKDIFTGSRKGAGKTSKIEVRHCGASTMYYYCHY